jgi:hypothetical protein
MIGHERVEKCLQLGVSPSHRQKKSRLFLTEAASPREKPFPEARNLLKLLANRSLPS